MARGRTIDGPLELYSCRVRHDWIDYNGHMTTVAYHIVYDDAFEQFLRYIGCDDAYRAAGSTMFVADNRVRFLRECKLGTPLSIRVQLLGVDSKRLHVLHPWCWRRAASWRAPARASGCMWI